MAWSQVNGAGRDVVRRRILAYVADAAAVVGCVVAVLTFTDRFADRRLSAGILVSVLVANPYHVVLEGTTGQTLGKRLLRIRVLGEDGEPCTYRGAAIRTGFRFVDWLPVAYLVGLASMLATERQQRLGDLAAGTVVVRDERQPTAPESESPTAGTVPLL